MKERSLSPGFISAILAYVLWGLLPLYWKLLDHVLPFEILLHRILWSFLFSGCLLLFYGKKKDLISVLQSPSRLFLTFFCGFLVSSNWYIYIWAVNSGRILDASMGYYINPLIIVLLSVTVLKEKLSKRMILALLFAFCGVLVQKIHYGIIPWIALLIAGTFAVYGLFKKMLKVDVIAGLFLETLAVFPIATLLFVQDILKSEGGFLSYSLETKLLLMGSGVATATPLFLFAKGTQTVNYSIMGFLQYIGPSISLLLGVFLFEEPFTVTHMLSFGLVWLGLILLTLGALRERSLLEGASRIRG